MNTIPPHRWRVLGRHRPVWALGLVLTCWAAVTGCGPSLETSETPASTTTTTSAGNWGGIDPYVIDTSYTEGSGPRVAVIGDSLTVAGRSQLFSELSGYRVKIASVVGEGIGGGPWSRVFGKDVLGEATEDYLAGPEPPEALVLALGTNNAWQPDLTVEMFEGAWPEMVSGYEGSCLVVVTSTETTAKPDYDWPEAAMINQELRATADRVVEWSDMDRPDFVQDDHIHLHPEGLELRARLIADAVDSCAIGGDPFSTTTSHVQPAGAVDAGSSG